MQRCRKRNLKLYFWFEIFSEPLLWGPILTKTVLELGRLSLAEMYFQEAICVLLMLLIDIPTGAVSDLIGRKRTLIIGQFFLMMSFITFAFMNSPLDTWIANLAWAIGFAFQSGADKALIYESLSPEQKADDTFHNLESRVSSVRLFIMAVCALLCGWLASINLRLPLLISAPFIVIPFVISFFFIEDREQHTINEVRYSFRAHLDKMFEGVKHTFKLKKILWLMCFSALLGAASKLWFFSYNPYFEEVGLNVQEFGYVFFALNLVAWASAYFGPKLSKLFGERGMLIFLLLCVGIPITVMGMIPMKIMVFAVLFQNIVRGAMGPLFSSMSQKYINDDGVRSTVGSVKSSINSAAGAFSQLVFGVTLAKIGLMPSLVSLGTITLFLGYLCFRWYRKLFKV